MVHGISKSKAIIYIFLAFVAISMLLVGCNQSLYNYMIITDLFDEYHITAYSCNAYPAKSHIPDRIDVVCSVPSMSKDYDPSEYVYENVRELVLVSYTNP